MMEGATSPQRSSLQRSNVPLGNVPAARIGQRILVEGRVQGCGFRPMLCRLAEQLHLVGSVSNTPGGVQVEIEGTPDQVAAFIEILELGKELPRGSQVQRIVQRPIKANVVEREGFQVEQGSISGPLATAIPADVAVCPACLVDSLCEPGRRYNYALTTCAECGPRYSLIRAMPFDRPQSSMAEFPLCDQCQTEYRSPIDRRFHAQTISCPRCGPNVWATTSSSSDAIHGMAAIESIVAELKAGRIVAIRGVGGYQLLVDATNQQAVARLRGRKHRPAKPLAVMVQDLPQAETLANLNQAERDALASATNPIVVIRAKSGSLAEGIHPNLSDVGLMLPTTPLHAMLLRGCGRPLVCTSANREGEPLEYNIESSITNLRGICDAWLHHDREIVNPIDDSVVRIMADRPVTLRLGRGLAPLPLSLPPGRPTLATGGHMKSAIAWSNGVQAVLGAHIGDPDTLASRCRYVETVGHTQRLYGFNAEQVVHDLHPEYFTTQWAESSELPRRSVQHHYAHVMAGMLELDWLDREVLGVAWDGTGFGDDGTIWGGEFMLANATGYQRVAHILPFRLPGGDTASREPWRVAAVLIQAALGAEAVRQFDWHNVSEGDLNILSQLVNLASHTTTTTTTSVGRLFDAVACMILGIERIDYEAEAAMRLEAAADPTSSGTYVMEIVRSEQGITLDWRPLIRMLVADLKSACEPAAMAMRFHRALATAIAEVCRAFPTLPIVLSGGVFQNRLLVELVREAIPSRELGLPGVIPPGDGGLAAGQLAIALLQGT